MIPEAAVEALARLLAEESFFADPSDDGWNANLDSSDHFMPRSRITARIYLEAAAPHMLAGAWDDGHLIGWNEATANSLPERESLWRNPYRPTP